MLELIERNHCIFVHMFKYCIILRNKTTIPQLLNCNPLSRIHQKKCSQKIVLVLIVDLFCTTCCKLGVEVIYV